MDLPDTGELSKAGRCRTAGTPQVRPCRLGRGIRAADTPHSDTAPPLTVSRDLVGPRHAWMTPSNSSISTIDRKASTRGVDLHLPVDQGRHPPRAGHAFPTDRGNLSKAGWVRLRGREPHGCGDRAYMDVLAAAPATGPTPPTLRNPASAVAVAVEVAGQRPALRRVQGAALPANPP